MSRCEEFVMPCKGGKMHMENNGKHVANQVIKIRKDR